MKELKKINYKNYDFILKSSKDLAIYNYYDAILEIKKDNKIIKQYNIIHDFEFYYKIQKKQIKSSDIIGLFEHLNESPHISYIFFNKLTEGLEA